MIILHLIGTFVALSLAAMAVTYGTFWLMEWEYRIKKLSRKRQMREFRRNQEDFYNI